MFWGPSWGLMRPSCSLYARHAYLVAVATHLTGLRLQMEPATGDFVARQNTMAGLPPVEIRVPATDTRSLVMQIASSGQGMEVHANDFSQAYKATTQKPPAAEALTESKHSEAGELSTWRNASHPVYAAHALFSSSWVTAHPPLA